MKLELHLGFALVRPIIHIYPPIYTEEEQPLEKLKECYLKLFDVIKQEQYKSLVLPSLGTGFHRLSTRRCSNVSDKAIK